MDTSTFIIIIVIFVVIMLLRNRRMVITRKIIKKTKMEGNTEMKELAKRFMDKECVITTFYMNHQFDGVIKEVTDGAILIDKNGKIEAINLDFVVRIREYPRNKKGKKKSDISIALGE